MTWQRGSERSDRMKRLPDDWNERRIRVLRRDGYRCQIQDASGIPCLAPANQVDHVERGDDHGLDNLQAACRSCHARKSSAEGNAARQRRRRPPERHPGMV